MGCAGWYLAVWARAYCDAGYEAGGRFELTFLLPLIVVGGGLCGLVAWAVGRFLVRRAPRVLRVCGPMLLVAVATVSLAWWIFATVGTLDGYPADSGLCPPSNIPPWWPGWIPA